MVLHAWEQFDAAAAAYARAGSSSRGSTGSTLAGQVETRLAHHDAAARLLTGGRPPESGRPVPARLALADALLRVRRRRTARPEYAKLTSGASAPHADTGLAAYARGPGDHQGALAHLQTAVELYPEFGAAWYTLGMAQRNSDSLTRRGSRWTRASSTARAGRPWMTR
jgi:tetratricopeptide (TPR) repeat protein